MFLGNQLSVIDYFICIKTLVLVPQHSISLTLFTKFGDMVTKLFVKNYLFSMV